MESYTTITENKIVYSEFKFFKDIYTRLKISEDIMLYGDNGKVKIIFNPDSPFFIISGEFLLSSEFMKWITINNKKVLIKLSEINSIAKALKKNVISVCYSDNEFIFKFNEKTDEGLVETELKYINKENDDFEKLIKKLNDISLKITNISVIDIDLFSDELTRLFIDSNKNISANKIGEKFVEIPTGKIQSLQKNKMTSASIYFSDVLPNGGRYITIESVADDLKLDQTFLTI